MKAQIKKIEIIKNQPFYAISSPYNRSFVDALKAAIPYEGRKWDRDAKTWNITPEYLEKAKEVVRQFFEIEGEENHIEYEIVEAIVKAGNTSKRTYPAGVTIDGVNIINPLYGNLNRKSPTFEILESSGGFTRGDNAHAFDVEYQIKVKVRKGAGWDCYNRCGRHIGDYKILNTVNV